MRLPRVSIIVIVLFIAGLLLRVALINTHGTTDLAEYIKWGQQTYEVGLAKGFEGGYFPIQYQSLGLSYAIAEHSLLSPEQVIRLFNLLFEIGGLLLLVYLLKRYLSVQNVLIFFWLNPFAIAISQQGYVDPQFSFFILLSLFLLERGGERFTTYLIAGIPLGISLLMKPQSAPLFVGLGILAAACYFYKEKASVLRIAGLFIAPIILYAGFSLFFGLTLDIHNNHQTLTRVSSILQEKVGLSERISDISANSLFLTAQYIYVATKRMPAINAHMPNPWFFVATALNKTGGPIYLVKDTDKFFGISYRTIGFLLFMTVLVTIIFKIRKSENPLGRKVLLLICFIPILLPYLTTSAHENHFYFGFIASIILGGLLADRFILFAGYALATLNAVNLVLPTLFPYYLHASVPASSIWTVTLASSVIFFLLLYHFIFKLSSQDLANQTLNETPRIQP